MLPEIALNAMSVCGLLCLYCMSRMESMYVCAGMSMYCVYLYECVCVDLYVYLLSVCVKMSKMKIIIIKFH
jgi:hypothetical protein